MNTTPLFDQLELLLQQSEDEYFAADSFISVEELIASFGDDDWNRLLSVWDERSEFWKQQVASNLSRNSAEIVEPLIEKAILRDEPEIVITLMTALPAQAGENEFYNTLLNFAVTCWYTTPELRRRLKHACWRCGISKKLLDKLGVDSCAETNS